MMSRKASRRGRRPAADPTDPIAELWRFFDAFGPGLWMRQAECLTRAALDYWGGVAQLGVVYLDSVGGCLTCGPGTKPVPLPPLGQQFLEEPGNATAQMPPPFRFEDVDVWGFPLAASYRSLSRLCDVWLNRLLVNQRADYEYRPLQTIIPDRSVVILEVLDYGRMYSTRKPYRGDGYLTQHELYFSFPVVRWQDGAPAGLELFVPFIYVDNPWSMICGREVLGFPKMAAKIELPSAARGKGPDYPISAQTMAYKRPDPDQEIDFEPLVEIGKPAGRATRKSVTVQSHHFGPVEELYGPDGPFEAPPEQYDLLERSLVKGIDYGIVEFQQFRNAEHPRFASYHALVHTRVQVTNLESPYLLKPTPIEIRSYASLDIPRLLGLEGKKDEYRPFSPFRVQTDFDMVDAEISAASSTASAPRRR